ncbi:tetratricopeptide repeat protein [Polaribacter sp. Asnod1-A03]|uniref:tetratricopeptide repeat protein n=1 Tax=Polaribacter sp. Asnod1-A03 TaxID=3160581 RepID=UPI00386F6414
MIIYYLTIALQVFCIYHAYKNGSNYYWYFIIFFIPVLGSIIYLITNVINKKDVTNITEEITTIINPTKKIKDLEKELEFSNTFQNKINLADAYLTHKDYEKAIFYYENALEANFKDEPYTLNKLIKCYFKIADYDKVIAISHKIDLDKDFKESLYFYGLALEKKGNLDEAENQLKKVDVRYSNYTERLEFSNFLVRRNKNKEAKEVLTEIISEIQSMSKASVKNHRLTLNQAEKRLNQL